MIYKAGEHNSFHPNDNVSDYLHGMLDCFFWLCEHTGNGIVGVNMEISSDAHRKSILLY